MIAGDLLEVAHRLRGRLRLRLRSGRSPHALPALASQLSGAPGVRHVRVSEAAASIVLEYDPAQQSVEQLLQLPVESGSAGLREPARIDETILIQATPEQIWALLDGGGGAPSQVHGLLTVEEDGPGAWRVGIELLGRRLMLRIVRGDEDPPRRVVFRIEGALNGRCVFTLTPEGGGARVREQVSYALANTLLDRTLGRLAEPVLRRMARTQLASLPPSLPTRRA
jgi:carbon monoxide dehydrogenase subunit G